MTLKKNKKKREQRDKIESQFEFIRIYLNGWKKKKISNQNQVEQIYVRINCAR